MDTWEAIRHRRNVRSFSDQSIPREQVERLIDAARRAPSSMNEQRWAFVVVTDDDRRRKLASLGGYAGHAVEAPVAVACVVPDAADPEERESIALDLGQAIENMMLAAWEAGIGSCHGSLDDHRAVGDLLGIPQGWRCDLLVSLGYPSDSSVKTNPPKHGGRRPLSEVLRWEGW